MLIFTGKARATIGSAILSFGDPEHRKVWIEYMATNPPIRRGPDDPFDDGTGPTPEALREAIVSCCKSNYDFILERQDNPLQTEDSLADDAMDAMYLCAIAQSVLGSVPDWRAE
jgi:hypothetical protein